MSCTVCHLNHVTLVAQNVETTADFYRTVLGFHDAVTPAFPYKAQWLQLGEGMMLHIVEPANGSLVRNGTRQRKLISRDPHFAFTVTSVASAKELLLSRGVPHIAENLSGFGVAQIFFHDPDGHLLELLEEQNELPKQEQEDKKMRTSEKPEGFSG